MIKSFHWITAGLVAISATKAEPAVCAPQRANPIVVEAPAPLEPIQEAYRILDNIEREIAVASERNPVSIDTLSVWTLSPEYRLTPTGAKSGEALAEKSEVPSVLVRAESSTETLVFLDGLEPGVYTIWWMTNGSPKWASGAVVRSDGFGLFHAKLDGTSSETSQLNNPVRLVVKRNGTAETDIEALSRQLTSLPAGCADVPELGAESHLALCATVRHLTTETNPYSATASELTQAPTSLHRSDTSH